MDGIAPEQYGDALLIVRVFDKLMRVATAKDALGENPWRDVAGYGLCGVVTDLPPGEGPTPAGKRTPD